MLNSLDFIFDIRIPYVLWSIYAAMNVTVWHSVCLMLIYCCARFALSRNIAVHIWGISSCSIVSQDCLVRAAFKAMAFQWPANRLHNLANWYRTEAVSQHTGSIERCKGLFWIKILLFDSTMGIQKAICLHKTYDESVSYGIYQVIRKWKIAHGWNPILSIKF